MTELERLKRDMDGLRQSILKFNDLTTLELSKSDCDEIRANITFLIADFDKLLAKVHYEEEVLCYYQGRGYRVGDSILTDGFPPAHMVCQSDGNWLIEHR